MINSYNNASNVWAFTFLLFIGGLYTPLQDFSNVLLLVSSLVLFLIKGARSVPKNVMPLVFFCISIILSMLVSIDFNQSLIPSIYLVFLFAISVLVSVILKTKHDLLFFLRVAFWGLAILAIRNFLELDSSSMRFGGIADQPNALAVIASSSIIILHIFLELCHPRKTLFFISIILIIMNIVFLYLAASRGAIISLLFAYFGYLWFRKEGRLRRVILLSGLSLLLSFLFWPIIESSLFYERLVSLPSALGFDYNFNDSASTGESDVRVYLSNIAIEAFLQRPILGNGASTFIYFTSYVYSHSSHLEVLFAFGLAGAIPYFYFLIKNLFSSIRYRKKQPQLSSILFLLVTFFLLLGFSIPNFQAKISIVFYILMLVIPRFLTR